MELKFERASLKSQTTKTGCMSVKVNFSDAELRLLSERAKTAGVSVQNLIRRTVLKSSDSTKTFYEY